MVRSRSCQRQRSSSAVASVFPLSANEPSAIVSAAAEAWPWSTKPWARSCWRPVGSGPATGKPRRRPESTTRGKSSSAFEGHLASQRSVASSCTNTCAPLTQLKAGEAAHSLHQFPPERLAKKGTGKHVACTANFRNEDMEDLQRQHSELKEEFLALLDCLEFKGWVTAADVQERRRSRQNAATFLGILRTSALVQSFAAAAGPEAMTSFAACCGSASSGVRSLLLLPKETAGAEVNPTDTASCLAGTSPQGERAEDVDSNCAAPKQEVLSGSNSSTTAEGNPLLEEDIEPALATEMLVEKASPIKETAVVLASGSTGLNVLAGFSAGPNQQVSKRYHLTSKLLSAFVLGWRRGGQEEDLKPVDPPEQVALRLHGIVRSIARFSGASTAKQLAEAVGKTGLEVFRGGGLLRELAGRGQTIYICGGSCGAPADSVDRFCPSTDLWENMPRMQVPRRACAVTSTGGKLYVMGGVDVASPLEEGLRPELLEPATGAWELLPPMGQQFPPMGQQYTHAAAAASGGFVYVFGGLSGGSVLDQAQRFDPLHSHWECLEPMPTPRFECAAAATRNEIYVLGGANVCGDPLAAAECFSPSTGRWQALPPLASPRYGCAAAAVQGVVYVMGGHGFWESLVEAECFDPSASGSWRPLPPMPAPRNRCGAAAADGLIYVFGGNSQGSDALSVECFDPEACEWLALGTMLPTARGHCIASAVCT